MSKKTTTKNAENALKVQDYTNSERSSPAPNTSKGGENNGERSGEKLKGEKELIDSENMAKFKTVRFKSSDGWIVFKAKVKKGG
ncbi:MAG TPA: hypothetical protein VFF13_03235 [archaeon]|nr:hypothetical protein [archaeon]